MRKHSGFLFRFFALKQEEKGIVQAA